LTAPWLYRSKRRSATEADSDLGITCTILLLGKSGTVSPPTINILIGEKTPAAAGRVQG
jgi:hypothetical protein